VAVPLHVLLNDILANQRRKAMNTIEKTIQTARATYVNTGNAHHPKIEAAENFLNTKLTRYQLEKTNGVRVIGSRAYIDLSDIRNVQLVPTRKPRKSEVLFSGKKTYEHRGNLKDMIKHNPMTADNMRKKLDNPIFAALLMNAAYGRQVA